MSDVTIEESSDSQIEVFTPYHPDFPGEAKNVGGRWVPDKKCWRFDARDRVRVEEILADIYGYTPAQNDEPVCTIRVALQGEAGREYRLAGRTILTRPSRDESVRLAKNVILVEGSFDYRGGSRANPAIDDLEGVVLEWRDIPVSVAKKVQEQCEQEEKSWDRTIKSVEIVDQEAVDLEALRAEKERLLARIAEIDALLGESN